MKSLVPLFPGKNRKLGISSFDLHAIPIGSIIRLHKIKIPDNPADDVFISLFILGFYTDKQLSIIANNSQVIELSECITKR